MRDDRSRGDPGAHVALSADTPKFRELGRFITTVVRAALLPVMGDYIERLESELNARSFRGMFYVIKSNGGVMQAALAKEPPRGADRVGTGRRRRRSRLPQRPRRPRRDRPPTWVGQASTSA